MKRTPVFPAAPDQGRSSGHSILQEPPWWIASNRELSEAKRGRIRGLFVTKKGDFWGWFRCELPGFDGMERWGVVGIFFILAGKNFQEKILRKLSGEIFNWETFSKKNWLAAEGSCLPVHSWRKEKC